MLNLIVLYIKGYYWFGVNGLNLLLLGFFVVVSIVVKFVLVFGVYFNLCVSIKMFFVVVWVVVMVGCIVICWLWVFVVMKFCLW